METSAQFCHIFPVACSRDAVAGRRSRWILFGVTVFLHFVFSPILDEIEVSHVSARDLDEMVFITPS